jgi:hypothetical protein
MGKFLDRFKDKTKNGAKKINELAAKQINYDNNNNGKLHKRNNQVEDITSDDEDNFNDEEEYNEQDGYNDDFNDDVAIQSAQKPESFHHFILDNQYKDLELDIRGYKEIKDKDTQQWKTIRKKNHCFTDEQAEMLVRKVQSNLSPDIKLGKINKEHFGSIMDSIFKHLLRFIRRMMEYEMGHFGSYDEQGRMKSQAVDIFENIYRRIYANYSRSIGGSENQATHESVKGQESLQSGERDYTDRNRGYS